MRNLHTGVSGDGCGAGTFSSTIQFNDDLINNFEFILLTVGIAPSYDA